jgi:catechol 2,3-dioxygenase-like lactoylglutathione lyase family enzyme
MKLSKPSIALFVKDINISKNFYFGVLKQELEFDFGKNIIFKNGLTIWEINSSHIIPKNLGLAKISNKNINRFEIYFETDNLKEVFEELKNNNVGFLHEIHEEPWGQDTIRFFDPDNHLIEIGESMQQFVGKLFKQGMTAQQIAMKTSVPIQTVEEIINQK